MSNDQRDNLTFQNAAERVRQRWVLVRWLRGLAMTGPPLCAVGLAAVLLLRWSGVHGADLGLALPVMAAWLAVTAGWAWRRRPGAVAALALWDRRANRPETFVSALCFESRPAESVGERLHLRRARRELSRAISQLGRDLPLQFRHRTWIAPAVLLIVAASPLLQPPVAAEDQPLDEDARARVTEIGEDTARRRDQLDRLAGLDPQERKKLDELKDKLEQTARQLEAADVRTRREALTELENLANQADNLAAAIDAAAEQADLSSSMIEELERHTDTAEFGSSLRGKHADEIAQRAREISDRLKDGQLTLDEQQRFKHAFDQAMDAADDRDTRTRPGKAVEEADRRMKQQQAEAAGKAFDELAEFFERKAMRDAAKRRLQELARAFRAGGQNLIQPNQGGMRQLARADAGLRRLQDGQAIAPMPMPGGAQPPNRADARAEPFPGGGQPPMPGQAPPAGGAMPPMPGGEMPEGAMPPIPGGNLPPIPGGCPTGRCEGACAGGQCMRAGMGQGATPIPGQSPGGLQAGHGSAGLGNTATDRHEATSSNQVNAAPVNAGASRIREIASAPRREGASRAALDTAVELIAAEQEALEAEPLPMSRRRQVRQYFNELRRQFEHAHEP